MPLTPEDVSNKRFTPVRLREGYDMGEVDQFLDEVEAELARLTKRERGPSHEARRGAAGRRRTGAAASGAGEREGSPSRSRSPSRHRSAARRPASRRSRSTTAAEASSAAARLLEIATRNADELVDEAKDEADKIVGEARTKAERLEAETKTKADRLESDARTRAQMLDSETARASPAALGDLEKEKEKLNAEVENLRSFEREYRSRLKSYFSSSSRRSTAAARAASSLAPTSTPRSGCSRCSATTTPGPARLAATTDERGRPRRPEPACRRPSDPGDARRPGASVVVAYDGAGPRPVDRGATGSRRPARPRWIVEAASTSSAISAAVLAQRRRPVSPVACQISAIRSLTSKPLLLRASWTSRTTSRARPARTSSGVSSRSSATVSPCSLTTDQPSRGRSEMITSSGSTSTSAPSTTTVAAPPACQRAGQRGGVGRGDRRGHHRGLLGEPLAQGAEVALGGVVDEVGAGRGQRLDRARR